MQDEKKVYALEDQTDNNYEISAFENKIADFKQERYPSVVDELKRNFIRVKHLKCYKLKTEQVFSFLVKKMVGKIIDNYGELLSNIENKYYHLKKQENRLIKFVEYKPNKILSTVLVNDDAVFYTKLQIKNILGIKMIFYTFYLIAQTPISYYSLNTSLRKFAVKSRFKTEARKLKQAVKDNKIHLKNLAWYEIISENWKEKNSTVDIDQAVDMLFKKTAKLI